MCYIMETLTLSNEDAALHFIEVFKLLSIQLKIAGLNPVKS